MGADLTWKTGRHDSATSSSVSDLVMETPEKLSAAGRGGTRVVMSGGRVQEAVVKQHDQDTTSEGQVDAAQRWDRVGVEDVHDAHHHVEQHLLPLGHAEVGASVHHPEGHGAPVHHHEDAEVDVEEGGEEGEREDARRDGEEAPEEVQEGAAITHGALIITRVSQQLVVRGEDPGQREEGAQGGDACTGKRRMKVSSSRSMLTSAYSNIIAQYQRR
ncbi:hypothetical protein F7725_008985 [Dissostichus mawsoni]|uniref:Uncharacterized protein n=1 Tax=Dissostichus mawsoni TaxID=36200 RepID=A0A7J5Z671_DISMA|nr:hypothetical protein F7725_008985 [Dissostichus mawsoni]